MLSGNRRRKIQRITVGVVVGALVLTLALSLISAAWADATAVPARSAGRADTLARVEGATIGAQGSTTPISQPVGSASRAPRPVTKTPQGQATQVSDQEHIGGLIGYLAFMLGGVVLLVRARRRGRRERASTPILS